jgi:hypothetical protein
MVYGGIFESFDIQKRCREEIESRSRDEWESPRKKGARPRRHN